MKSSAEQAPACFTFNLRRDTLTQTIITKDAAEMVFVVPDLIPEVHGGTDWHPVLHGFSPRADQPALTRE
jgi:hypothetical protein